MNSPIINRSYCTSECSMPHIDTGYICITESVLYEDRLNQGVLLAREQCVNFLMNKQIAYPYGLKANISTLNFVCKCAIGFVL